MNNEKVDLINSDDSGGYSALEYELAQEVTTLRTKLERAQGEITMIEQRGPHFLLSDARARGHEWASRALKAEHDLEITKPVVLAAVLRFTGYCGAGTEVTFDQADNRIRLAVRSLVELRSELSEQDNPISLTDFIAQNPHLTGQEEGST